MEAESRQGKTELERRRMEIQAEAEDMVLELLNEQEKQEHELKLAEASRVGEGMSEMAMMIGMWTRMKVSQAPTNGNQASTDEDSGRSCEAIWFRHKKGSLAYAIRRYRNSPIFRKLGGMFRLCEIPADLRAKLLLPFLSLKAKSLISRLNAEELEDYEEVPDIPLSEFKLTPREYKMRFDNATKRTDKTFIYFAARNRNKLRYYLRSRDCLDGFERVFSLLISDKLKSCLSAGALNYVLSLEGNDWFDPRRIGELADTYDGNHTGAE